MILTPTAVSGAVSGAGLWTLFWGTLCKIDLLGEKLGFGGSVSRDDIFGWVSDNKGLTIIMTEFGNLAMHYKALSSPVLMSFVLGGTAANGVWIYGVIPAIQKFSSRKVIT